MKLHMAMTRARIGGFVAGAAALTTLVMPAAPAAAVWDCENYPQPCTVWELSSGLDVFGEPKGDSCHIRAGYAGREGTQYWWSGIITGATYLHADIETRRMQVTCAIRTGSTATTGTIRGSVTASSVAPLNNVVSATGLTLDYWSARPPAGPLEPLYLCTTVTWVDKFGLSHTHYYDFNPNAAGAQCPQMVRILDV